MARTVAMARQEKKALKAMEAKRKKEKMAMEAKMVKESIAMETLLLLQQRHQDELATEAYKEEKAMEAKIEKEKMAMEALLLLQQRHQDELATEAYMQRDRRADRDWRKQKAAWRKTLTSRISKSLAQRMIGEALATGRAQEEMRVWADKW